MVRAPLPAFFIADLHLSDDEPANVQAFLAFAAGPARQAGSLFILGDLFEYWAGDDDAGDALNASVCAALQALAGHGVQVFFMRGNRDLLVGDGFAQAAGVRLLADPALVAFEGGGHCTRLLLSHGDQLCTDDLAYQAYRRQVHDAGWQASFLAQPLDARKDFIRGLRERSEAAKRSKPMAIMDVNADAVAALLRAHACTTLIHGHTHRPARHRFEVDGRACVRHVLADWQGSASWLAFDGSEFRCGGEAARVRTGTCGEISSHSPTGKTSAD